MADNTSPFSKSQRDQHNTANGLNPPDTSNIFDSPEPAPVRKKPARRPPTTRPVLHSRPEPRAIQPDRLNSRPSRPHTHPGSSRPPIYRPGTANPAGNETLPLEASTTKTPAIQPPSSRPALSRAYPSKPAPSAGTHPPVSRQPLSEQLASQVPGAARPSTTRPPTSRQAGSKPSSSPPPFNAEASENTLSLEDQNSPAIIRLRRKEENFPFDDGDEDIVDTRPSAPVSAVRRESATTPITLPRRRFSHDNTAIIPELHPEEVASEKALNQMYADKFSPGVENSHPSQTEVHSDMHPAFGVPGMDSAEIERVTDPMVSSTQNPDALITDPALALTVTPTNAEATLEKSPSLPAKIVDAPPSAQPAKPPRQRKFQIQPLYLVNLVFSLILIVLACASLIELGLDITSPHLIISQLNAENGSILTRQDSGTRLAAGTLISTPLQSANGLLLSAQTGRQSQMFTLHGETLARQGTAQQVTATRPATLTTIPDGNILVTSQTGIRLLTPAGQPIWSIQGSQPSLGAHSFQPAFDTRNIYTVKSTYSHQVAAYDLTSGQERWSQTINDSLDFAPPFQVDGKQLYVASDHQVTALNLTSRKVLWTMPLPTRTLLLVNGKKPFLLSAGVTGLNALDPLKGTVLWKSNVQPTTSTGTISLSPVQFYQAAINTSGTIVYASGTRWESPAVREQVWLAAFETSTGKVLWSKEAASGLFSADSSRTLPLLIDDQHNLVIQQLQPQAEYRLAQAFDATTGLKRWQTGLDRVQGIASSLFQQQDGSLLLASVSADTALFSPGWSTWRLELVLALGLSLLVLGILGVGIWLLDRRGQPKAIPMEQRTGSFIGQRMLVTYASRISGSLLLLLVLGAGILAYFELNGTDTINPSNLQRGIADRTGNVLVQTDTNVNHQIAAIDSQGHTRWQNLSSEGSLSIFPTAQPAQNVLALLRGHLSQPYRFAPVDIAYPNPLESLELLSCFDRQTGSLRWQTILNPASTNTRSDILGNDQHLIYVASLSQDASNTLQFYTLEQSTGNLVWTLTVPHTNRILSTGTLNGTGSERIWHVGGKTYTIDINAGRIVSH